MASSPLLLGYELGQRIVSALLLDAKSGRVAARASVPAPSVQTVKEADALSGAFVEAEPEAYWQALVKVTKSLPEQEDLQRVRAFGLSSQMHGLVLADKSGKAVRPAILWQDARAETFGEEMREILGEEVCIGSLLNLPDSFPIAKLLWLQEHEPQSFERAGKAFSIGDYLAFRLIGEATTTLPGLSEGAFWDFAIGKPAAELLERWGIPKDMLPKHFPVFAEQGRLTPSASSDLGLPCGTPMTFRAGDEPGRAFSMGALLPGTVCLTADWLYAISDRPCADTSGRFRSFAHLNYHAAKPRYAASFSLKTKEGLVERAVKAHAYEAEDTLMGLREQEKRIAHLHDGNNGYGLPPDLRLAQLSAIGAEGLSALPFGRGEESLFEGQDPGFALSGLDRNLHGPQHLMRAAQEGAAFALRYGLDAMRENGFAPTQAVAARDGLFPGSWFAKALSALVGTPVEVRDASGAEGAARGAGVGVGIYLTSKEAFVGHRSLGLAEANAFERKAYEKAYVRWKEALEERLAQVAG